MLNDSNNSLHFNIPLFVHRPEAQSEMKPEIRDLPHHRYEGSAGNQHTPNTIEPCTTILHNDGGSGPGRFHLLQCGHIAAIDGEDTRCGINCQETVHIAQSSTLYDIHRAYKSPQPVIEYFSLTTNNLLSLPAVQRPDFLYCEICQGIPWDNYRRMQPPSDDPSRTAIPMPRRCLALTRGEIVATVRVPDVGVEILLASPFPNPNYDAHSLCCGHRVWCASPRNCARNCHHDRPCIRDSVRHLLIKQADVIFYEECIFRAERMHTRWEEAAAGRSLGLIYNHQQYG